MSTWATCVWYHPTPEHAANVLTYADEVDQVLIVDNSPVDNAHLMPVHPKLRYVPQFTNTGIARALNLACRTAIAGKADWILTMDQDSSFARDDIRRLLSCAHEHGQDNVAIFAPSFDRSAAHRARELCDSAITSGSLVRLAAYVRIGGYNEDLFLDDVDHEFGYRLRRNGFQIVRVNSIFLHHRVGDPLARRFLWHTIHSTNHSAVRKYYMTRNRLYMRKHFAEFGAPYLKMVLLDAVKVVLIEHEKRRKLACMTKGVIDYFRGNMGELRPGGATSPHATHGMRKGDRQ